MNPEDAKLFNFHEQVQTAQHEARFYSALENQIVRCRLCPRQCVIPPNKTGFCKVRKNFGGRLYALSYGKATEVISELIETEAVYHFKPGAPILSLGNFGCNLNCLFCQNWETSQFQYTDPAWIHDYSSQQIIQKAKEENIDILSWTYNDPAVWMEFVIDTAKEARKQGLYNLFKSAGFLNLEPVRELASTMDIFSLSLKSMDPAYYKKFTGGQLPPVLDVAKYIYHETDCHLEISNLVVTDLNTDPASYQAIAEFVMKELGPEVPLHFTRFHPAFRYTNVERTPLEVVQAAREYAQKIGIQNVYTGNVFDGDGLNTYCQKCRAVLVRRYGLTATVEALDGTGKCTQCGHVSSIRI